MRLQEQIAFSWISSHPLNWSLYIVFHFGVRNAIGCAVHSELLINKVQCETLGCVCFHLIVRSSIVVCLLYWFELICDAKCFAVIEQGHATDQLTQLRTEKRCSYPFLFVSQFNEIGNNNHTQLVNRRVREVAIEIDWIKTEIVKNTFFVSRAQHRLVRSEYWRIWKRIGRNGRNGRRTATQTKTKTNEMKCRWSGHTLVIIINLAKNIFSAYVTVHTRCVCKRNRNCMAWIGYSIRTTKNKKTK